MPVAIASGAAQISEKMLSLLETVGGWRSEVLPTPGVLASRLGYASESGVRYQLNQAAEAGLLRIIATGEGSTCARFPVLTDAGRELLGTRQSDALRSDAPRSVPQSVSRSNITDLVRIGEPESGETMPEFEPIHAGPGEFERNARRETLQSRLGVQPETDYSFRVVGTCMEPIFREGDVLVMRRSSTPPDGSIAHVDVRLASGQWEPLLRQIAGAARRNGSPGNFSGGVLLTLFSPQLQTVTVPAEQVMPRGALVGVWRDAAGIQEMLREMNRR